MTKRNDWIKTGLALAFLLLLALGFLKNAPLARLRGAADCLLRRENASLALLQEDIADWFPARDRLLDLNGEISRRLDQRGFYGDLGIYVADGDYLVTAYPETSTDYELEQLLDLRDFLEANGVRLLYVCKPGKYLDDSLTLQSFGVESWLNRNADKLVSRLREAGVPTLDLRESIRDEGLEIRDLFYRTDHHWTTRAALWAVPQIAGALNESCGYALDLSLWDGENFVYRDWESCWLGEQGRKLGAARVGLDDYTEILPAFETRYRFYLPQGEKEDSFAGFVDESYYDTEQSVYRVESWHYAYERYDSENLLVPEGKILLLGDSYDQTTVPFLSLGVHRLDSMVLRYYGADFDLRAHILDGGYDTVIVCYAPLLIGAHDDPDSGNYRMYTFS